MHRIHPTAAGQLCLLRCATQDLRSLRCEPLRKRQVLRSLSVQLPHQHLQAGCLHPTLPQEAPRLPRLLCQCQQKMDAAHITMSQSSGQPRSRKDQFHRGIRIFHFLPSRHYHVIFAGTYKKYTGCIKKELHFQKSMLE